MYFIPKSEPDCYINLEAISFVKFYTDPMLQLPAADIFFAGGSPVTLQGVDAHELRTLMDAKKM